MRSLMLVPSSYEKAPLRGPSVATLVRSSYTQASAAVSRRKRKCERCMKFVLRSYRTTIRSPQAAGKVKCMILRQIKQKLATPGRDKVRENAGETDDGTKLSPTLNPLRVCLWWQRNIHPSIPSHPVEISPSTIASQHDVRSVEVCRLLPGPPNPLPRQLPRSSQNSSQPARRKKTGAEETKIESHRRLRLAHITWWDGWLVVGCRWRMVLVSKMFV